MVKYYFDVIEILGESGLGCGAGYVERMELPDSSDKGVTKCGLFKKLENGIKDAINDGIKKVQKIMSEKMKGMDEFKSLLK